MNATKISLVLAATLLAASLAGAAAASLPAIAALAAATGPYAFRLKLVWLCAVIAAAVYAVMVYGLLAAKRPVDAGNAAQHGSRRAELLWAVIPAVILIGLALPAVDRLAGLAAAPAHHAVIVGPAGP